MHKRLTWIALAFLILSSCNGKPTERINEATNTTIEKAKTPFNDFIGKFPVIHLPFIYSSNRLGNDAIRKMVKLDSKTVDSAFVNSEFIDEIYCYGLLADTTNFYSLICFFPADSFYPVLATYSKSGKLISQEDLLVYGCGSDCGLSYCSSTAIINKDLSLFCADTVKYKFQCDSLGEPLPNSGLTQSIVKQGKVRRDGKIELGKEVRTEKNSP